VVSVPTPTSRTCSAASRPDHQGRPHALAPVALAIDTEVVASVATKTNLSVSLVRTIPSRIYPERRSHFFLHGGSILSARQWVKIICSLTFAAACSLTTTLTARRPAAHASQLHRNAPTDYGVRGNLLRSKRGKRPEKPTTTIAVVPTTINKFGTHRSHQNDVARFVLVTITNSSTRTCSCACPR
jgi:hypothetical protein